MRFVPAGARGEGIDAIDLVATDRTRVGESTTICGVDLRFVVMGAQTPRAALSKRVY